jgi:ATP-dependent RNA helicase RhlE
MNFSQLGLSEPILRALAQEGYTSPTPIQRAAIPLIMRGCDVLGCAQTGTGKTAAFALPILHRLSQDQGARPRSGRRLPRALILSPTRELAGQIADSFAAYGRLAGLSHAVIYGGVSQAGQERALARGVDIIVATPGRLIDLLEQGLVDLARIEVLVLDEGDRMLDMGFIDPIRRIAARTPASRQTLLFSATMPGPIVQLAGSLLRDPVRVAVDAVASAAPRIEQAVYMLGGGRDDRQMLLEKLLADPAVDRAVVFSRTKHGAERIGRRLERSGIAVATIHGNKNQNQRQRALDRFRSSCRQRARVLVATDVAARGLDVDGISHVINFDMPLEAEAYIHRIGRTGRAGASGIALSFCGGEERGLLRDIERLIGIRLEVRKVELGLGAGAPAEPAQRQRSAPASPEVRPGRARPARSESAQPPPRRRPNARAARPVSNWNKRSQRPR